MAEVATTSTITDAGVAGRYIASSPALPRRILSACILLGVVASLVYFSWWVDRTRLHSPWLLAGLACAVMYVTTQVYGAWYVYLHIEAPAPEPAPPGLAVDVFVPVYDEAYELVQRCLTAVVAIRYPHRTYLLDDARHPRFAALAARVGARYLTRAGNGGAKAGNINAALAQTGGEFVTIFDVDHVPAPDFLDAILGHFGDPKVGFVQSWVAFHNYNESLVARAAAEQGFDFYGPTSMGMHGCGAAPVWGSHCTFRRSALDSIGGHQVGLAEDLHTSLRLHAAGWRSVFVPSLNARGQVPTDLSGIAIQHFKWARGVFEMALEVYPRLVRKLSFSQNIAYLVRLTNYLIGPVFLLHMLAAIFALVSGNSTARVEFARYVLYSLPLTASFVLVRHVVLHLWHLEPDALGFHWRGYALTCALWPVYTLAFVYALLRFPVSHLATPKERSARSQLPIVIPQLIVIGLLLGGRARTSS